ncbi:hypothetical protein F4604DRAFT_1688851 [Suillus subluteus]|nr:hypothetical protein F4604DRAFT_1688851 [Suillus subluteus]
MSYEDELQVTEESIGADDSIDNEHPQSYLSSCLTSARREYFSITLCSTGMIPLMMRICMSVHWAALAYSDALSTLFDMHYGQASTILRQNFSWSRVDPTIFASDENMMQAVIDEQVWLALVVKTNATDKLSDARKTGNSTFNSTSLLTVHYAQARQEIVVGTYVLDYGNLLQPPWRDYIVSCCCFCTEIFHIDQTSGDFHARVKNFWWFLGNCTRTLVGFTMGAT